MTVLLWVVLVVWVLTFIRTIANLVLLPRLNPAADPDGPLVSIVIPARNEQDDIERTVRAFLAQTYRRLEVIVVDDRSTDDTGSILARLAAEDARLRVISGTDTPAEWLGKPWALHQGSRAASGEILLFVDADILYATAAVAAAVERLRITGAAMLTVLPRIVMESFWERVAMPQLAIVVYSFLPTWLSNRSTVAILGVGGGTGNMIRRADYDGVGGHEALRSAVVDDVGLARLVRSSGRRTAAARAEHLISVRMYESRREIVDGFTKNTFAVLNRSYTLTIVFAVLGLLIHVLPYVLALTGEMLAIATVAIITLTRLVLFIALDYPLHYAVWAHPLMVLFWTWISLRSMWITGVRRQLAWRGRSYDAKRTRFGA